MDSPEPGNWKAIAGKAGSKREAFYIIVSFIITSWARLIQGSVI
jgi:hypothetical protein